MCTCDLFMSTCNIIMSTCDLVMSTCNIIMFTCDLFMSTCNIITMISYVHVSIIMVHVDINKSPVNIIMLHVDIIYLALRGQKYAIISLPCRSCLFCLSWFYRMGFFTLCLFQRRCIMSHQNLTDRYLLGRFYSVSAAVPNIIQSLGPDIGLYILYHCHETFYAINHWKLVGIHWWSFYCCMCLCINWFATVIYNSFVACLIDCDYDNKLSFNLKLVLSR